MVLMPYADKDFPNADLIYFTVVKCCAVGGNQGTWRRPQPIQELWTLI